MEGRIFDGAAPSVAVAQGGGPVTTGVGMRFAATATDELSGPPSVSWDFGDGATAAGTSAEHAYASAGTYTVTVTATDGAGNRTSATTTVVASAPPPPPPPPPPPAVTIAGGPRLALTWRGGEAKGEVTVTGTSGRAQDVTVRVRALSGAAVTVDRRQANQVVATITRKVAAGPFSLAVPLPAGLLPGGYGVELTGADGPLGSMPLTVGPPATGIVRSARATVKRSGRTNRLMARFTFAVRPSAKARITTQWIAPPRSGIRRGQQSRSNAPGITATLGVTRGFGRGGWRCILRVNGETVAVARTTL